MTLQELLPTHVEKENKSACIFYATYCVCDATATGKFYCDENVEIKETI